MADRGARGPTDATAGAGDADDTGGARRADATVGPGGADGAASSGGALAPSWRDHEDRPTSAPPPAPGRDRPPFYRSIGDFQGTHYRRNAFARGTIGEADALVRRLDLQPGQRVLDVGCGDGRHLRALAPRGIGGVGIDASRGLVEAAQAAARDAGVDVSFQVGDARDLAAAGVAPTSFDVAWSLCQGGFGTHPVTDAEVVAGMGRAVRRGGLVAFTAFHALFAARHLVPGDRFDPIHGVHHQLAEVRGPDGEVARFDLWTTAYTVGEAVALAERAGLVVLDVAGVEPGRYGGAGVALDDPEVLVVARRGC